MKPSSIYQAAEIPDEFKTYIGRLYNVMHGNGKPRQEFVNEFSEAGLTFSTRQLDRWAASARANESAISPSKVTGAAPALHREHRDIVCGWVLDEIYNGRAVKLSPYCKFVLDSFGVKISLMTASNYLSDDGFSSRVMQKKSESYEIDVERLRSDYWNWVKSRKTMLRKIPLDKLASIDFTFTGHRTERRTGFGIRGGAQPMENAPISKYTNCIITCGWADGINRTPPILYTFNPNFRRDRSQTHRRTALESHLDECLAHYKVDEYRVVYIGKFSNEKEHYVRECPELLRLFFEHYGVEVDATILSDNGNSFFTDGSSVLVEIGFKDHIFYDSNTHQWASMNDNRRHGTSKHTWRNSGLDFSDDVKSSVALLHYLDRDILKYSNYWFHRNILDLEESGVPEVIASAGSKKSKLHKGWLRAYRVFLGGDARGEERNTPEELKDRLDGLYWDS